MHKPLAHHMHALFDVEVAGNVAAAERLPGAVLLPSVAGLGTHLCLVAWLAVCMMRSARWQSALGCLDRLFLVCC
jgi:hypothetical protein